MSRFISILAPDGVVPAAEEPPEYFADLRLDQIIAMVTAGNTGAPLAPFFHAPLHDAAAISYRHDVFRDLQRREVREPIAFFLEQMRTVRERLHWSARLSHPLQQRGWLVYAAEAYCRAVETVHHALADIPLKSQGLRGFADFVTDYRGDAPFSALASDTDTVREHLRDLRYTVHVDGLHVSVDRYRAQKDYSTEVIAVFDRFVTAGAKDYRVPLTEFSDMNNVEEQILDRVAALYPDIFEELSGFCSRNADLVEPTLARFEAEAPFYLAYLDLVDRLSAGGLAFSYPHLTDDPGALTLHDVVDLALALKLGDDTTALVRNDITLRGAERILVITGPNQGGKTTFARTVGQCLYLAALGCPVAAQRAAVALPDHIFTHFEREESLTTLHGKLDDELVRIHGILARATGASVVVMNESFASTTSEDALVIGTEVLRLLIERGCIAVYVTFLDELSSLNPACVSMVGAVADDDPTRRTFRFTRRPADGRAYAAALARRYHLTYPALRERITR